MIYQLMIYKIKQYQDNTMDSARKRKNNNNEEETAP
jgi:hypothetical protein